MTTTTTRVRLSRSWDVSTVVAPLVVLLLVLPLSRGTGVQAFTFTSLNNRYPYRFPHQFLSQQPTTWTTTKPRHATVNNEDVSTAATVETEATTPSTLTVESISKLRYRELQQHLAQRQLPTDGTTGQLRQRLRVATGLGLNPDECIVNEDEMGDDCREDEVRVCCVCVCVCVSQKRYR
jgi:hypothetical protein